MTEFILIGGVCLSSFLFALGGTGFKWARRFLLPTILWGLLILMGINIIQSGIAMGILVACMCLGYGESTPWWGKALVALSYAIPSLIIGFSWWCVILPPAFLIMFLLSNLEIEGFTWKIVELSTGFLIGCSIMCAGLNPWSLL